MRTDAPLRVHLVRHGKIASHAGDMPLTEEGVSQAEAVGQHLREEVTTGESVSLLYAPTRRTCETAMIIHRSLSEGFRSMQHLQIELLAPIEQWAIRNPDIYVAGTRIELVSTAEALLGQLPSTDLTLEEAAHLPFMRDFYGDPDRIGYWLNHPNPPGEDADTVARRLLTFALSLLDLPRVRPRRYICVTHSPVIRAFLRRYLLEYDLGEPDYVASVDIDFATNNSFTIHYLGKYKKMTTYKSDQGGLEQ